MLQSVMAAPPTPPLPWTVTVDEGRAGQRVDEGLATLLGVSVNAIKRLCAQALVLRGRSRLHKGERLKRGDHITLLAPPQVEEPAPQLKVLHQSAGFLVLDKPAGLACHKLRPQDAPSALDAALVLCPQVLTAGPDPREGGLLHRLDVGTSGALAFALHPAAYEEGRQAFKTQGARKLYLALVHGPVPHSGEVSAPVAHDPGDPRRSVVVGEGAPRHRGKPRSAVTLYQTLHRSGPNALLLIEARGGRRHQVRVHMAHAGAPLWGDDLYGGPVWPPNFAVRLPSHALHAVWLHFVAAGETVEVTAAVPVAFEGVTSSVLGDAGRAALAHGVASAGAAVTL